MNERERAALYEKQREDDRRRLDDARERQRIVDERLARERAQPSGEQLRDEAITRVEEAADEAWREAALTIVMELRDARAELTTDDVWARMPIGVATHEPRAMGAVMRRAAAFGWIAPTDRTRKSLRPDCHARPVRVWRTIYKGAR